MIPEQAAILRKHSMNNQLFRALQEKSFLLLLLGELFTQIAFNLLNFFLILHVYQLTKSNTAVSFVVVSFTLPAILFGILAGVYVDRWDKKRVLFMTNVVRGILLIILALFYKNIFVVYLISFLVALVTQFFVPAESPMIPLVVREKLLFSANALFGLGLYGSILLAYLFSGPIILLFGQVNTLFFLAMLFFIGAIFISGIRTAKKDVVKKKGVLKESKAALMHEVKSALTIMKNSRDIYNSLFLLALAQILLLILAVIAPGYAEQVLNISIQNFPIRFIAPAALGVLAGALILGTFLHDKSKDKLMTLGLFLSGFAMLLLPYGSVISARDIVQDINRYLPHTISLTPLHLVVVLAFVLGLANAFVFVPSNTILQEKTTDEFRGKIYGALNALVGIFSLIPILTVGGLSDLIGVGRVIVGIGIVLLALGVSRLFFDI